MLSSNQNLNFSTGLGYSSVTNSSSSVHSLSTSNKDKIIGKSSFKGGGSFGEKKGIGKQLNSGRLNDSYALSFPNALPVKQIVWAKDSWQNVWKQCCIVYARLHEDLKNEKIQKKISNSSSDCFSNLTSSSLSSSLNSCQLPSFSCQSQLSQQRKPEDYDYYVHWIGHDRRLDCWVTWTDLREFSEQLPKGENVLWEVEPVSDDDHAGMDEEYLREHEEATKLKTICRIRMGKYWIETWYFSPYPREYQNLDILYICEFCLSFFREESEVSRHTPRCECRYPPGNEIYRNDNIAMFEIDGNHFRVYCENLCYLSKLFLDHKTLRHPVNLFLFYVMTEIDKQGYHVTGYFSKEKYSRNNVSCILTLPQHQRKGYGKFLIDFSYSLSKKEGTTGTPERPLSDLGKASYMAYWTEKLVNILEKYQGKISVQDLSRLTCMETTDIISCLEEKGILKSKDDCFFFFLPKEKKRYLDSISGKIKNPIHIKKVHWTSYDYYFKPFELAPQM